ncbi:hypothetical protein [Actinomadura hibisca]|uniref:hypothetical protein n=1 Tax=Actinomadura hibisca TaxID=68565 RepID=UPI000835439F|nr:hypothetical protein [Actinomadura hibisca]
MRVRTLTLSAVLLAASLPAVGTAHAAAPLTASIVCDPATGTISTRLSGDMAPNYAYKVEFSTLKGSTVDTAGAHNVISSTGVLATVPVTSDAGAFIDAAGYSKTWQPAGYRFYTETVRAIVRRPSDNAVLAQREGTCTYDTRTQLTLTCDKQAGVFAARSQATAMRPSTTYRVEYLLKSRHQSAPGEPVWSTGPFLFKTVETATAADGTLDVTGFSQTNTKDNHLQEYWVTAEVKERRNNVIVGRADAYCLYSSPA